MFKLLSLWSAGIALCLPGSLHATVVYSNLDPGNTYRLDALAVVGGQPGQAHAVSFIATGNGILSTIELALRSEDASVSSVPVSVELHANVVGNTIGALLSTGTTTPGSGFGIRPLSVAAMSAVPITSGPLYWIIVSSPTNTAVLWNLSLSSTGLPGAISSVDTGGFFQYFNGSTLPFRVSANTVPASTVPEPSVPFLLVFVLGVLSIVTRVRRCSPH
jgi:hypothetical protein